MFQAEDGTVTMILPDTTEAMPNEGEVILELQCVGMTFECIFKRSFYESCIRLTEMFLFQSLSGSPLDDGRGPSKP